MRRFTIKTIASSLVLILIMLVQGCATPSAKLSSQDRADLKKLDVIKVVHLQTGWPSLNTAVGVVASNLTFGLSDDWSEGQKLVKKFEIEDPNQMVKADFLRQIKAANVANFVNDTQPIAYDEREMDKMKARYGNGVVLKFSPAIWQIWYYPFNWARYQMWFGSYAELVRLEDSKVLWNAGCRADQKDSETAPTLDELTADNSTVLKKWVKDSTEKCARQLVNDFMGKV